MTILFSLRVFNKGTTLEEVQMDPSAFSRYILFDPLFYFQKCDLEICFYTAYEQGLVIESKFVIINPQKQSQYIGSFLNLRNDTFYNFLFHIGV